MPVDDAALGALEAEEPLVEPLVMETRLVSLLLGPDPLGTAGASLRGGRPAVRELLSVE